MSIVTVGVDLAKNVFAVDSVDDNGKAALVKPKISREYLPALIAQLPPCVIGMEACSGAHYCARQLRRHGDTVKLMLPKFVTRYLIALGLLTIAVMLWAPKGLWDSLIARHDLRRFPVQRDWIFATDTTAFDHTPTCRSKGGGDVFGAGFSFVHTAFAAAGCSGTASATG